MTTQRTHKSGWLGPSALAGETGQFLEGSRTLFVFKKMARTRRNNRLCCFACDSGAGLDVPVDTILASKGEAEPAAKKAKLNGDVKEQDDR